MQVFEFKELLYDSLTSGMIYDALDKSQMLKSCKLIRQLHRENMEQEKVPDNIIIQLIKIMTYQKNNDGRVFSLATIDKLYED